MRKESTQKLCIALLPTCARPLKTPVRKLSTIPAEVVRNCCSGIVSKRTSFVSCNDATDWDDAELRELVELTVEPEVVLRIPPPQAGLIN